VTDTSRPPAPAPARLGGQAVIEGVMVRAGDRWAVAARRSDGGIAVHRATVPVWAGAARRVPLVRGVLALATTVALGMRALSWSRSVADGTAPASRRSVVSATVLSVAVFVAVFALAPAAAARLVFHDGGGFVATEAVLRLALFVGYVAAIGRVPGIRRTFEYHGAEHQAIAAYEAGDRLDLDSVRRYSPRHARCGTDFLMLVAVVAVVAFALVSPPSWLALAATRVLLLPVVAGLAYEVLRVSDRPTAGRWLRPLMAPGLAVQGLTTRPPSDDQIEVAIAAVHAALAPTGAGPAH
jgi:uncharacterized protein YqhQ